VRTFRQTLIDRVNRPLRKSEGGRLLYAIGVHMDLIADMAAAAVHKAAPGYRAPYDNLGHLSRDRRIPRGPGESPAAFALRLRTWRQAHRLRGGAHSLLGQVRGYFSGLEYFQSELVYRSGKRYTQAPDGTITRDFVPGWDLEDGPNNAERWARWILILRPSQDYDLTRDEIVAPARAWNAAHCEGHCTVMWLPAGSHVWNEPGLTWDSINWNGTDANPRMFTGV